MCVYLHMNMCAPMCVDAWVQMNVSLCVHESMHVCRYTQLCEYEHGPKVQLASDHTYSAPSVAVTCLVVGGEWIVCNL